MQLNRRSATWSRAGRGAAVVAVGLFATACGDDHDPGNEEPEEPLESGDITTWAGNGNQGHDGDGRAPEESWLNQPMEVAFDAEGRATIVDWNNHAIRRETDEGVLETFIGQPIPGDWPCEVPTMPEYCEVPLTEGLAADRLSLNHPMDVIIDGGTLYFSFWHNHKVAICENDTVSLLAGRMNPGPPAMMVDAQPASEAVLNFPDSIALDSAGAILVSDERNNRVRRISAGPDRTIRTVVGADQPSAFMGEGTPALEARLGLGPYTKADGLDNPPPGGGIVLDDDGNLYLADTYNHCVRRVAPGADGLVGEGDTAEELITTVAGACGQDNDGYSGDGGPAVEAKLKQPHDLEIGPDGALYVADTGNHVVRRIDLSSGEITTIAGTGEPGFGGDGFPAVEATLRHPYGLAFDGEGDLFIVDTMNNRIRRVLR